MSVRYDFAITTYYFSNHWKNAQYLNHQLARQYIHSCKYMYTCTDIHFSVTLNREIE